VAGKNRALQWCRETAEKLKKSINSNNSMGGAGRQAGRWLWGRKRP